MLLEMRSSPLQLVYPGLFAHWCPGCGCAHMLEISSIQADERRLGFDGDVRCPSFEPDIVRVDRNGKFCRYSIKAGRVRYDRECTHALAGKTIDLPDFPVTP